MSVKFFLDTNIFVYSFDSAAPAKAAQSTKLIRKAIETRAGVISYQVVEEFFNVALRSFSKPMTVQEAEQYLAVTFRPLLTIHSSPVLYGHALRIAAAFQLDWYDSLAVASALEARCDLLYSEDLQNGLQFGSLTIANPFS